MGKFAGLSASATTRVANSSCACFADPAWRETPCFAPCRVGKAAIGARQQRCGGCLRIGCWADAVLPQHSFEQGETFFPKLRLLGRIIDRVLLVELLGSPHPMRGIEEERSRFAGGIALPFAKLLPHAHQALSDLRPFVVLLTVTLGAAIVRCGHFCWSAIRFIAIAIGYPADFVANSFDRVAVNLPEAHCCQPNAW